MKIIIVTQEEPFFIPQVLKFIVESYRDYIDSIVFLKPDEYKKKFNSLFFYIQFWGFRQSLKFGLRFIKTKYNNKDYLNNLTILRNVNVNSEIFLEKSKDVDYIISIAANQIFKEKILEAPKKFCLNIHAGLLPKYRGYNPSFWVLYNNEKITGITIHKMELSLDSGPIIMQEQINIHPGETWYSLQNRVASKASEMLANLLPLIIDNRYDLKEQKGESSLYRKPTIKHGKDLRRMGKKFI